MAAANAQHASFARTVCKPIWQERRRSEMMQQIYPAPAHSYRYELNKDFQFAAAHYVPHEDAGVCRRLHGHTYFVNVTVVGNDLNESGFLVNFKDIKDLIHKRFDHTVLNE